MLATVLDPFFNRGGCSRPRVQGGDDDATRSKRCFNNKSGISTKWYSYQTPLTTSRSGVFSTSTYRYPYTDTYRLLRTFCNRQNLYQCIFVLYMYLAHPFFPPQGTTDYYHSLSCPLLEPKLGIEKQDLEITHPPCAYVLAKPCSIRFHLA